MNVIKSIAIFKQNPVKRIDFVQFDAGNLFNPSCTVHVLRNFIVNPRHIHPSECTTFYCDLNIGNYSDICSDDLLLASSPNIRCGMTGAIIEKY